MLTNLNKILILARQKGYAIGSFNVHNLETIQAVFNSAISLNCPVIIAFGEKVSLITDIQLIAECVKSLAHRTSLPIVLHLDHCKSENLIIRAIQAGFTSVMYDGSDLSLSKNIENTKRIVKIAHAVGVSVEAELGCVPVKDTGQIITEDQLTKPEEAKKFVEQTECDALAIAVGTIHGNYLGAPKIFHNRLKEIAQITSAPLVLHGGSGNTEEDLVLAIDEGISKININTEISNAAIKQLMIILKEDYPGHLSDISRRIREAMQEVIKEKMILFARGKIGCLDEIEKI